MLTVVVTTTLIDNKEVITTFESIKQTPTLLLARNNCGTFSTSCQIVSAQGHSITYFAGAYVREQELTTIRYIPSKAALTEELNKVGLRVEDLGTFRHIICWGVEYLQISYGHDATTRCC